MSGGGGWLSGGQPTGGIKLTLDLAIGGTSQIESTDKSKIQDIVQKVKDLNGRLQDIRREQVFQRVCSSGECGHPCMTTIDRLGLIGTRSRISRSIRVDKCTCGQVDATSARRSGPHLRLAVIALAGLFYQAEADLRLWK